MIKWCKKCILPNTRPNLIIDINGVCNICNFHQEKKIKTNWEKKEKELKNIFDKIKKISKNNFDCIIPVSGGKDSVWQVYQCLKYGLTPLAITYKSPGRNIYGDYNLKGLINLGVDHIDYTINQKVESYFMLKTFKEKGSTAIPMHLSIFNLPIILAKKLNIPLIVYGENPASEYGFGEKKFKKNINKVDKIWIKKYASLNNTDSNYWKDSFLENKKMFSYDLKIFPKNLKILFLGEYLKWNPQNSLKYLKKIKFIRPPKPKTGYYNFADIDCDFISIHHYLKWYKFGFTRLFDNLSIEIRNKKLTRGKALRIIKNSFNDIKPKNDIKKFCKFVNISVKEFDQITEKFRNRLIWKKTDKKWKINNFIVKDFNW